MAAILNSAILDSNTAILDWDTLLSSLSFTQKSSLHSDSDSNINLMMAAILNSVKFSHFAHSIWLKLIHSHLNWWWQSSWILPSWIQTLPSWIPLRLTLLSSLSFTQKTLSLHSDFWLKLIQPFWTLMLDSDTAMLDSDTLLWIQLRFTQKTLTSILTLTQTWWWQPSWILPSWIQTLPSWIQTPCYLNLSDSLKNTLPPLWLCLKLIPSD